MLLQEGLEDLGDGKDTSERLTSSKSMSNPILNIQIVLEINLMSQVTHNSRKRRSHAVVAPRIVVLREEEAAREEQSETWILNGSDLLA